jgi:endonuclease/exonuclease/phosphatase family metal-dependent hydrolase
VRVRVVTYNIRKGKGADGRSSIGMDLLGRELARHSADLVLCQEVFHCARGGASQSDHLAEAMGLRACYGANKFRGVGHHGNSTFTSLDVDCYENHDISTNKIERRGALYVRLSGGATPVHVVNVHLGLNRWQRRTQMRRIAELLDERAEQGDPVVLAGDFNDWRRELDRFIIEELGFDNAHGKSAPEAARTWHSRRPVFSLDRIYTRNLTVTQAHRLDGDPWSHLSDHLPLVAEVRGRG